MTARRKKSVKKKTAKKKTSKEQTDSVGFETKLWAAADLLRNNMDPTEYKHAVLGLLFLKYIEDAFEERWESSRLADLAAVRDVLKNGFAGEG